jgi:hypothetical protein
MNVMNKTSKSDSTKGLKVSDNNTGLIDISHLRGGLLDAQNTFDQSRESWKQKLLIEIEKSYIVNLKIENKDFRLIGLPFFNAGQTNQVLPKEFDDSFKDKLF